MQLSEILGPISLFLFPPALLGTVILYTYPIFSDCSFPVAKPYVAGCFVPGQQRDAIPAEIAPFRLLTLADPQLEGDSSLPERTFVSAANLWTNVARDGVGSIPANLVTAGKEVWTEDLYNVFQGLRKRVDLWGNDLFLAHVYRSVRWWSNPTHTVVLGDLLGSQHISDAEFKKRSRRFWKSVFRGMKKVPRSVTDVSGRVEVLGDDQEWRKRIIAVAGNHDIGYAGDITEHRIARFEETYGSVNWAMRFLLDNDTTLSAAAAAHSPLGSSRFQLTDTPPELRLLVLNSMNLDSPAKDLTLQQQSRDFTSRELHEVPHSPNTATVLLTHIPLYKEAGICTDGPYFEHLPAHEGIGIKEQNHLTLATSRHILDGLTAPGAGPAVVLNGHDHEGCHVYHSRPNTAAEAETDSPLAPDWTAKQSIEHRIETGDDSVTRVREITVRSMMGSFHGNAGFLSGWYDRTEGQWRFEYGQCTLGVQHLWWGVHILDLVCIGLGVVAAIAGRREMMRELEMEERKKAKKE